MSESTSGRAIPGANSTTRFPPINDDLEVYEVTIRKRKRGTRHHGDDGSGPQPAKHVPWTREYWDMREAKLATMMTRLFDEEEPTLKVLFLDDDLTRHVNAEDWLEVILKTKKLDVTHVRTVGKAIQKLDQEDWDVVCLDHDLEDAHYREEGQHERTGMDVVDFILRDDTPIGAIIVHSWNTPRAKEMFQRLSEAGHRVVQKPFGSK